jgi:serine/threonine protein phosphatase PrpC
MNLYDKKQSVFRTQYITQEIETRQLGKIKQDHVAHGSYIVGPQGIRQISTYWTVLFDGHGNNQSIDAIRFSDINKIMEKNRPYEDLQSLIQNDPMSTTEERLRSGSTMIYAKVTPMNHYTEIEIVNIGDSSAILFVNKQPIFVTQPHDHTNGSEIARLFAESRLDIKEPFYKKDSDFEVISPTDIVSKDTTYIKFKNGVCLGPSQSLGHNGITGINPTITKYRTFSKDNIKILLFSDGVSTVMPVTGLLSTSTFDFMKDKTTTDILNEAEYKWKKQWTLHSGEELASWFTKVSINTTFTPDVYDDCCCGSIEMSYRNIWGVPENTPPNDEEIEEMRTINSLFNCC